MSPGPVSPTHTRAPLPPPHSCAALAVDIAAATLTATCSPLACRRPALQGCSWRQEPPSRSSVRGRARPLSRPRAKASGTSITKRRGIPVLCVCEVIDVVRSSRFTKISHGPQHHVPRDEATTRPAWTHVHRDSIEDQKMTEYRRAERVPRQAGDGTGSTFSGSVASTQTAHNRVPPNSRMGFRV